MKRELCLVVAMFAGSVAVRAQSVPAPPPMKMGLWQNTITNTMSGLQLPPDVVAKLQAAGRPVPGAAPTTTVTQSCMTPESWQNSFTDMQQKQNCQITNLHQSATGMSGDMACTSGEGSSKGHMEATFVSTEKMNWKVHLDMTTARQSQPIIVDANFDSVYQGADCKGISPDAAKVVR